MLNENAFAKYTTTLSPSFYWRRKILYFMRAYKSGENGLGKKRKVYTGKEGFDVVAFSNLYGIQRY